MKLKKIATILLSAMLSIGVLAGCSNNSSNSSADKKELVYGTGVYATTGSLDPAEANYNGWFTLRYGAGETLFKVNDDGTISPWLVEEYKNTDDTTWELKIKDGIKFSNGKQVTAKEVKASLDRILDKEEISAGKALSVDSIDADGQKLTIKTSKPNPALPNQLCDPDLVALGITCLRTAARDASKPCPAPLRGQFDRVVCDVPCSGLGAIRRKPEIRYKGLSAFEDLPELQYRILVEAAALTRPGGVLQYSTCTLNPAENEQVAERFLRENPAFSPRTLPLADCFAAVDKPMGHTLTLFPHMHHTDGFFLAAFVRSEDSSL